ncbi:MAG: NADPH-dependent glutamate synthase, partial [Candidatus Hydrogenedentota bacterium]
EGEGRFDEVAVGLTFEAAHREAMRCRLCANPQCVLGCPVEIDIPAFIGAIQRKDLSEAARILKDKNNLPAICGRVCPQETQCEAKCILNGSERPVAIGALERFVADWEARFEPNPPTPTPSNGHKVAVIGSGPGGLTCAADLAKMGYDVTIFEAFHDTGGVLRYGIPEFRLPKHIVDREVEYVKSLGVKIELNMVIGKVFALEDLFEQGFEAIFIAVGAGAPAFLNIEGENLVGVYSANEFLTRVNLMKANREDYDTPVYVGRKVAVIGAGNVSMDAARTAKRLGADEVSIVYRRSRAEMPARAAEIEHAEHEGIIFQLLTNPKRILGDESQRVRGLECVRMQLGEPDESGRRRPVPIPGSEFEIDCDMVIPALGNKANPLLTSKSPGIQLNKWGNIVADTKTCATSMPGVFAGGDIVIGAATVIEAMGAGKRAARAIDAYIKEK